MTLLDYQSFIGRTGTLEAMPDCHVAVTILDVRSSFGRIDVLIAPIAGSGSTWVSINRVILKVQE
jgi:hypothetical protein